MASNFNTMQATVYNKEGKQARSIELPASVFSQPWNANLMHDVVVAMQSNARAGTADTKDRSEVRGGGKKPWRQKGTGRARHGSRRSPIWARGGVAHGPLAAKDYTKKLNRNVRAKALSVALSQKLRDDEVIFLDTFDLAAAKTKDAKAILTALSRIDGKEALATKRKNAALIVLAGRDEQVELSFRNFGNLLVEQARNINPVELLSYKYVIVADPEAALETLAARTTSKARKSAANKTT